MHLCLWKTLSQDCPHGEIRQCVVCGKIDMQTYLQLRKKKNSQFFKMPNKAPKIAI
jgi:hypothetical protein